LLLTIAVAAMLAGSAVAFAQSAAPASRSQLDSDLARATGVSELLQVAARYASAGYQQEAKAIVDRAAQRARSSGDWQSISAAYLRLGYTDNANAAQRRSRSTSR
jgi:ABC-type amino acid transport substrate-binding protein